MSFNKYMHPRNIYKKPPNFKELAIKYPEFRRFAIQGLTGKVSFDFKNPVALCALTRTLLEKDFGLHVDIPSNRLIPTVPLRLNYLLWVEDLLHLINTEGNSDVPVHGIDIGTGASCIYPLLAAKQNKWHMLASEVDSENVQFAKRNVEKNGLTDFITVSQVSSNTILKNLLDKGKQYDFCMCNPPFFGSEHELDPCTKSRSSVRPPPHNGLTGDLQEVVIPGGEVAFIKQIIAESKELGTLVRIYSTMIGHKSSVKLLNMELQNARVTSSTKTEFCQGRTMRWGLAWTFMPGVDLEQAATSCSRHRKSKPPMSYIIPKDSFKEEDYTLEAFSKRLLHLLKELQMEYQILKQNKYLFAMRVTALKNTWSNQRRKRRGELQQTRRKEEGKDCDCLPVEKDKKEHDAEKLKNIMKEDVEDAGVTSMCVSQVVKHRMDEISSQSTAMKGKHPRIDDMENATNENNKRQKMSDNDEVASSSISQSSVTTTSSTHLIMATLCVREVVGEILVELTWLDGTGGRDTMHQVLQYLKNNLK